jgi:RNA polymerase sigma-70 factor (ECF subfamily)
MIDQQSMPVKKKSNVKAEPRLPSEPLDPKQQAALESRKEDAGLIAGALNGNQDAFKRLRQKYHDPVFRLIYRMLHDKQDVEDLVQEAFIKAFQSLASFNHEYAFSTWLFKIASNNCIDFIRRKKLHTFSIDKPVESTDGDYSIEIMDDSNSEPDREMIAKQRKKLIEDAINKLPEKYRLVIQLRHVEEKDYQEISDMLDLPLGTVKAHIFRAREILYRELRDKLRHY